MTLPLERARSRRPVTWLTLLGVLLLPVVIGGLLVAALYNPTERLDAMHTAVVNDDEPVTVDGQMVPLGRQLTAGLVAGSDDAASNLTWTISNREDAASGLADGTYDAVVTIPSNFSAAATSTSPGGTPEKATIDVRTAPDGRVVDDAITAQVTQTAATLLGRQLSTVYLENVLLGFTTLGDQLGQAADGASQLADGAGSAREGAVSLADGVRELAGGADALADGSSGVADGASQLADGASQLADGAGRLADGAAQTASGLQTWADGAAQTADGAQQWSAGAASAASGLQTWADGATSLADGQRQISDALGQIAGQIPPDLPQGLTGAANAIATDATTLSQRASAAAAQLSALSGQCDQSATPQLCSGLAQAAQDAQDTVPVATGLTGQATAVATGIGALTQLPALGAGLGDLAQQSAQIAGGMDTLAGGAQDAAGGAQQLSDSAAQLASGTQQLGDGAAALAAGGEQLRDGAAGIAAGSTGLGDGAGTLADGADRLADGATTFASGAGGAADGADQLAGGVDQLATGTSGLADGLGTAVAQVPSYTKDQASDVASVVADPVTADGLGTNLFGASAVPLLAVLALWFGGLASFIALQAVPVYALSSRRPSALLALRSLAPAAVVGALQGILVAGVVQIAADYSWSDWWAFAGLAVVAGVAFAAVNQALVAAFGGAGRWIAALVGVLAVATGVVSTVPGVLSQLAGLMPTAPAYSAMLGALTTAGGVGAGLAGMIVWALVAFLVTIVAVTRRRATSARAVLAATPA